MNNKIAIKKMFSIFLFWTNPMCIIAIVVWSYLVNYMYYSKISEFKKDSLLFENYDSFTDGDGVKGGTIEAYGKVKSSMKYDYTEIGVYDSFGERYKDNGLDSLSVGDLLPIWYSQKQNFSHYRFKNEEIQDLYAKFWKHCLPIYGLFLIYLFLTIRFYKKYRKYDLNDIIKQNNL